MSDGECIHGLGPVAACVICNGRTKREAAEADEVVTRAPAKYEGTCWRCDSAIEPGDTIVLLRSGMWVCEGCKP
jgi:hypothetical protein